MVRTFDVAIGNPALRHGGRRLDRQKAARTERAGQDEWCAIGHAAINGGILARRRDYDSIS